MWFTRKKEAMESLESLSSRYHSSRCEIASPSSPSFAQQQTQRSHPLWRQPWETPAKAAAILQRCLALAGLPKKGREGVRPDGGGTSSRRRRRCHGEGFGVVVVLLDDRELRHLVAYCWWKRGIPLGDLLAGATRSPASATWVLEGEDDNGENGNDTIHENGSNNYDNDNGNNSNDTNDLLSIYNEWKHDYLPRRSRGLASALERWTNQDDMLVTGVRDDEMV
mmetsp:Transcript_4201/g.9144  ORF Transcript_4201/g.9144 Transcript_4201/m.9144 type:complete len:223 (+) Transcript_4201:899-1567(+)